MLKNGEGNLGNNNTSFNNDISPVNIDSLLETYKQETVRQDESDTKIKSIHGILKKEETETKVESRKVVKFEEYKETIKDEVDAEEPIVSPEKSFLSKKQGINKLRSVVIKSKHQMQREDKTSKILAPILKV